MVPICVKAPSCWDGAFYRAGRWQLKLNASVSESNLWGPVQTELLPESWTENSVLTIGEQFYAEQ